MKLLSIISSLLLTSNILSSYTINRVHDSIEIKCNNDEIKVYESDQIYICLDKNQLTIDINTKTKLSKEQIKSINAKCGAGTFISKNTNSCLPCPPELTSKPNSNKCDIKMNVCDRGTFKSSENGVCLPCADGYTSKSGAKTCDYKDKHQKLNGCGEGTFSTLNGDGLCYPCPPGKSSKPNSNSCNIDVDDEDYDKYEYNNSCGAGTYYDSESETCLACESGYTSKNGAIKCTKKINNCKSGTFLNEETNTCENCPKGQYSQDNATSCRVNICGAGTYLEISDNTCYTCPKGRSSLPGSVRCGVMIDEKPFVSLKASSRRSDKKSKANIIISKTVRYEPVVPSQLKDAPFSHILPKIEFSREAPIITGAVNGLRISNLEKSIPSNKGFKFTQKKEVHFQSSPKNINQNAQINFESTVPVKVESVKVEPVNFKPISSTLINSQITSNIQSPFKITKAFEIPAQ